MDYVARHSATEKMAELLTWGVIDYRYAAVSIVVSAIFMLTIQLAVGYHCAASLPVMIYAALKFRLASTTTTACRAKLTRK
jgi:ATP-binding cassette subfamily B protein